MPKTSSDNTIDLAVKAMKNALYTEKSIVSVLETVERELINKGNECQTIASDTKKYKEIITNVDFIYTLCNNLEMLFDQFKQHYPMLKFEIEYRIKDLISSFKKDLRFVNVGKKNSFRDIHGIRIIVTKELEDPITICHKLCADCINFFITKDFNLYKMKDYISSPKMNGYQSIHIIFHSKTSNMYFEIQIRTLSMHIDATNGKSKHSVYKGEKYQNVEFQFDRSKIEMDGYKVLETGDVFDTIGLEKPFRPLLKNMV